jgi:hypothetical protein
MATKQLRKLKFDGNEIVSGLEVISFAKKHKLTKTFKGGAGPSELDRKRFCEELVRVLDSKGFNVHIRTVFNEHFGEFEPIVVCGARAVVYDRWGFCSCTICGLERGQLDQAPYLIAAAYVSNTNYAFWR